MNEYYSFLKIGISEAWYAITILDISSPIPAQTLSVMRCP